MADRVGTRRLVAEVVTDPTQNIGEEDPGHHHQEVLGDELADELDVNGETGEVELPVPSSPGATDPSAASSFFAAHRNSSVQSIAALRSSLVQ